jgi:hypothetical protein
MPPSPGKGEYFILNEMQCPDHVEDLTSYRLSNRILLGQARGRDFWSGSLPGRLDLSRTYFRDLLRTCEPRDRPGREDFLQAEKAVVQDQTVAQ